MFAVEEQHIEPHSKHTKEPPDKIVSNPLGPTFCITNHASKDITEVSMSPDFVFTNTFNDQLYIEDGKCLKCECDDIGSETLSCYICELKVHYCCYPSQGGSQSDKILASTSFGNAEKFANHKWFCSQCVDYTFKDILNTITDKVTRKVSHVVDAAQKNVEDPLQVSIQKQLVEEVRKAVREEVIKEVEVIKTKTTQLENDIQKLIHNADKSVEISTVNNPINFPTNSGTPIMQEFTPVPTCDEARSYSSIASTPPLTRSEIRNSAAKFVPIAPTPSALSGSAHILTLKPKDEKDTISSESWPDKRKLISQKLSSIKVLFIDRYNNGRIGIGFPDQQTKFLGSELVLGMENLEHEIYEPKKMLPKMTIYNVRACDIDENTPPDGNTMEIRTAHKNVLKETILQKNPGIKSLVERGSTLEVVYINKSNYEGYTVAIKVSPEIRLHVINQCSSRIYLFSSRRRTSDRCHYTQCYHCQKIGHLASECPDSGKESVCMFCAGNHRTMNCTVKKTHDKHKCANCMKSKDTEISSRSNTHNANSPDCPFSKQECQRLMKNTQLLPKN